MTNCFCISIPFLCFIFGKCTSFDRIRCLASMGDWYKIWVRVLWCMLGHSIPFVWYWILYMDWLLLTWTSFKLVLEFLFQILVGYIENHSMMAWLQFNGENFFRSYNYFQGHWYSVIKQSTKVGQLFWKLFNSIWVDFDACYMAN